MKSDGVSKPTLAVMLVTACLFVGGMLLLIVVSEPQKEAKDSLQGPLGRKGEVNLEIVPAVDKEQLVGPPAVMGNSEAIIDPAAQKEHTHPSPGVTSVKPDNVLSSDIDLSLRDMKLPEAPEGVNYLGSPEGNAGPLIVSPFSAVGSMI